MGTSEKGKKSTTEKLFRHNFKAEDEDKIPELTKQTFIAVYSISFFLSHRQQSECRKILCDFSSPPFEHAFSMDGSINQTSLLEEKEKLGMRRELCGY